METAVNVAQVQVEKYGTGFDTTVSYLGQMVTKKGTSIKSGCFVKNMSQPVKLKVMAFMGKVGCKKYHKAVLNSITKCAGKRSAKTTSHQV